MPATGRRLTLAVADARAIRATIGHEVRAARLNAGLSQRDAGQAVGMSHAQFGRIERAEIRGLTIDQAARAAAAVGLRLATRPFPSGDPVRDAGQLALLTRLRAILPATATLRTEVPVAGGHDLRAWDAVIRCPDGRVAVEAETRLHDIQALERKLALKERDGDVDRLVLLVSDTAGNRAVLRAVREALRPRLPLDGRAILAHLRSGRRPPQNGLLLL